MKIGIITVNLKYELNTDSVEEAKQMLCDMNMPDEYVEDSFDFVSIEDKE